MLKFGFTIAATFFVLLTSGCANLSTKSAIYSAYVGKQSMNSWTDPFAGKIDLIDSTYVGYSYTKPLLPVKQFADFGVEAMVGGFNGEQDHSEAALMISYDQYKFPWTDTLDTRFSAGLGWSIHDRVSVAEWRRTDCNIPSMPYARTGDCAPKQLPYWKLEVGVAVPKTDGQLTANLRLHHRSPAFQLVSEEGGGNSFLLGLRYQPK